MQPNSELMKQHFVGPIRPWDFIAKHVPTSENAPSCPRADFSEVPVGNTLRGMLGPLIKAIHKATGFCSTLQLFASRNALLSAKKVVDPDTADEAVFGTDTNVDLYPAIGVRSVLPASPGKARHKHKQTQKLAVATEDYDFTNTCLGIEVRPHLHFDPFVDCPQDELYRDRTTDLESEDGSGDNYSFESASPDGSLFRRQLVHHARAQLDRQHRTFFFQLVIVHRFARIIRWDRSGAIVTSRFDYRTTPQLLAEFFSRFAHMSDEQRGSDPTASLASEDERRVFRTAVEQFLDRMNGKLRDGVRVRRIPHAEKSLNDDFPTWRIRMVDKASFRETDLIVNCPINTQAPICSRATRAYLAYDTRQKRLVFLKDTWRTCDDHVWAESRTYKYLTSPPAVPHLPVVHYAGDVRGSDGKAQTTTTQDYARDKSGSWQKPRRNFLAHVHHRVVQDIVYRLDTAEDEKEFTQACHDALVAMQGAYEKGLVHHDISSGNIMLTADGKAVLNDWDWAGRKEDPGPSVGTWRFMSTMLLEDPSTSTQGLLDDLQALFWVFVHGILRDFTPGYRISQDYVLDYRMVRDDGVAVGGHKKSEMLVNRELDVMTRACHPRLRALMHNLSEAWRVFILAHRTNELRNHPEVAKELEERYSQPQMWIEMFAEALQLPGWPEAEYASEENVVKEEQQSVALPVPPSPRKRKRKAAASTTMQTAVPLRRSKRLRK